MNIKTENIILDTNLIIQEPELIETYIKQNKKIVLPLTILLELDYLKSNKEIGYIVRNAIRSLVKYLKNYSNSFIFDNEEINKILNDIQNIDDFNLNETLKTISKTYFYNNVNNDFKIIATAKIFNATIITKDISMSLIAETQNISVILLTDIDYINPTTYIEFDNSEIALNTIFNNIEKPFMNVYNKKYNTDDYYKLVKNIYDYYLSDLKKHNVFETWRFIIIRDDNKISYIYAINPLTETIERIDNKKEYNNITTGEFNLKAFDEYQICAIYSLKEAPATLLLGKYGSGKSLLATAYAMHNFSDTQRKVFISRPNIGLDERYDIGFLKGDKNEKMFEWLGGFMSALYYLYGNTKGQSYDYVKEHIFMSRFEILPINFLQGISILKNDVFIVDEIQLINLSYMTMILSRISEGAKLIMCGDLKQSYNVIKPSESGLLKLIKLFNLSDDKFKQLNISEDAKKYLSIVELKNYYRNKLTDLADGINFEF